MLDKIKKISATLYYVCFECRLRNVFSESSEQVLSQKLGENIIKLSNGPCTHYNMFKHYIGTFLKMVWVRCKENWLHISKQLYLGNASWSVSDCMCSINTVRWQLTVHYLTICLWMAVWWKIGDLCKHLMKFVLCPGPVREPNITTKIQFD